MRKCKFAKCRQTRRPCANAASLPTAWLHLRAQRAPRARSRSAAKNIHGARKRPAASSFCAFRPVDFVEAVERVGTRRRWRRSDSPTALLIRARSAKTSPRRAASGAMARRHREDAAPESSRREEPCATRARVACRNARSLHLEATRPLPRSVSARAHLAHLVQVRAQEEPARLRCWPVRPRSTSFSIASESA